MASNERDPSEADTVESPRSERETARLQTEEVESSAALDDDDIDPGKVEVLPGTGGPDDTGDVDVSEEELNLDGTPPAAPEPPD